MPASLKLRAMFGGGNTVVPLAQMYAIFKNDDTFMYNIIIWAATRETCLRGFRQGKTKISLLSYRD